MSFLRFAALAALSLSASVGCATIKADTTFKSGYDFGQIGKIGLVQTSFGDHGRPMEFEAASNQVGDIILQHFMKKGYSVVERNQIEAVLKEQQFQHSGMTLAEADAAKIGKILNLKAVLIANITKASEEFQMTLKMVDTQSAEILYISNGEGDTNKGLTSLLTTVGGGVGGAAIGTAVGGKGKGTLIGAAGGAFAGMVAGKLLEPSMRDCITKVVAEMTKDLPRGS